MPVALRPFSLPLSRPLETAGGTIDSRDGYVVAVDADGTRGLGEATPLPGWTESLEDCRSALEAASSGLNGRENGLYGMDDDADREALLPEPAEAPAARHGLELALSDLAARRSGEPLHRQLGARQGVDSVPVNAVVGEGPRAETVAAARDAVAEGFECVKLKMGSRSVEADAARVAAVREAVGPEPDLRVDANGTLTRAEAERALPALAASAVEYVEQPLPPDDLEGAAALRGGPVEIALDESIARHGPNAVLEAGAADVLICKPMVLGGPTRARAVADAAGDAGVRPVVTNTVDGVVARLGAVHLAASLPDTAPAGLATADRLAEDLGPDPAPVTGGRVAVPQDPGHGASVDVQEGSP